MWQRVRARAAEHGRDPDALALCVRANIAFSGAPPAATRLPFTGTVAQVVGDLVATHAAGAHEVLLELQGTVRDAAELVDRAAELRASLATEGLLD
jgi:hypothetical protein